MQGNITMLIWLGKQILGQRDVPVVELEARAEHRHHLLILPDNGRAPLEDLEQIGVVATPAQVRQLRPSE